MSKSIKSAKPVKTNGMVLGIFPGFDGADVVCIVTFKTSNVKTGPMAQIWFLKTDQKPTDAVNSQDDSTICGTCPYKGGNGCYVNVGQAPNAIWRKWKKGKYAQWNGDYSVFAGRKIRFGAYGDPVLLPLDTMRGIAEASEGWTGYTHAWRTCDPDYREFLMASVDSPIESMLAQWNGWRTFRVKTADWADMKGELHCPASTEKGAKLQCADCLACNGNGENARKANIVIDAHGRSKGRVALAMI